MVQIIQISVEKKHVVICICTDILKKLLFTFRLSRIVKYYIYCFIGKKKDTFKDFMKYLLSLDYESQNRILMYTNP